MKTRLLGNFFLSPVFFLTAAGGWGCGSGDKQCQAIELRVYQLVISWSSACPLCCHLEVVACPIRCIGGQCLSRISNF